MSKKKQGLKLDKVCKSFESGSKKIDVLQDLELTVSTGEMVAIVGESGVGKTTLLHIIGMIESVDSGEIFLNGDNITALKERDINDYHNRDVGFVFQFFHLMPEFTVLENVIMPLLIRGSSRSDAVIKGNRLIERVGLGDRINEYPAKLSGGEQQRVAIARALAGSPRILLADEPTGNLDPRTSEEVFSLIKELHRVENKITIVATHNAEIARTCDNIYILEKGSLRKKIARG